MKISDLHPVKLRVFKKKNFYACDHHYHDWQLDWSRLKELITDNSELMAQVKAGIAEDWLDTNGVIWDDRIGYHLHPNSPYNAIDSVFWAYSPWGTPCIVITFLDETTRAYALYTHGRDRTFHYLGNRK
ncbi:hypothetical protein [Acetilactobacillus jinshanensis]|uniref:Uncharacterized protein n=1 Tax=Acetilactobacillus jinshanensis TaxID=1720083 RepID=A0A4V1ALK7_9LACO|nr:hypothetical protein [Acetilactobacillus jinshanensis]QBP17939.1 hypothetical protein ELX58_01970 [Acetilactobacillus jinshanensis]URL60802.1 hypothetical protein HGK75_02005 [uncultured bacterium]